MLYESALAIERERTVKLPEPVRDGALSLEKTLSMRRSVRNYRGGPPSLPEISQLLWAGQGVTDGERMRTAPSAGALYPLELYAVVGNVTGLDPGVYKYRPHKHDLTLITKGDKRSDLCDAALGQSSIKNAQVVIVISAVYERVTIKYGERGIRYAHMEAGHAAQNIYLQAVPLDLGTVVIGAFRDERVRKAISMPGAEDPLYIMPVGKIR